MKLFILIFLFSSCSLLDPIRESREKVEVIEKEDTARIELHKELDSAIFFKKLKEVEKILKEHPNLINERRERNNHIFENIAFFNNIKVLRLIKKLRDQKIIDLDIVGIENPIPNAARNSLEMVMIFHDFGFSLNFRDSLGRDILEIAESRNNKKLIRWLKKKNYKKKEIKKENIN